MFREANMTENNNDRTTASACKILGTRIPAMRRRVLACVAVSDGPLSCKLWRRYVLAFWHQTAAGRRYEALLASSAMSIQRERR